MKDNKVKTIMTLEGKIFRVSISPDGKYFCYASTRENNDAIYIWDIKNNSERPLYGKN
jgi:Tol biopolymer transport system component